MRFLDRTLCVNALVKRSELRPIPALFAQSLDDTPDLLRPAFLHQLEQAADHIILAILEVYEILHVIVIDTPTL